MKTRLPFLVLTGIALLTGCGEDYPDKNEPSGAAGEKNATGGEAGSAGSSNDGGTRSEGGSSAEGGAPEAGHAQGGSAPQGGKTGSAGESAAGEAGRASEGGSGPAPEGGAPGSAGASSGGSSSGGVSSGGTSSEGGRNNGTGGDTPGAAGEGGGGGEPATSWYDCQGSNRAFVRRAILGVLGRPPVSQAEVSLYTDLMEEVDTLSGYDPTQSHPPGSALREGRRVVLQALFAKPEYLSNWTDQYRDFVRVQRVDEQQNASCYALRARPNDATAVAAFVRDTPPTMGGDGGAPFTMADVIDGSIALDDVTPIYTTNLFSMITKTYDGANAEKVALELSRRRDTGAWFDAVYLNRDTVCLNCHNSEFSVTQTNDPATNRHYPVPGHLEKALFGLSTGPATYGGYESGDRLHAVLRYTQMVNDCTQLSTSQVNALPKKPDCPTTDKVFQCRSDGLLLCSSDPKVGQRNFSPWGWSSACGQYIRPSDIPIDMAFVEAKLGSTTGLRASVWDVWGALRRGFDKLHAEGLGVQPDGSVPDPDKALAYLTAMNIAEKVWREVVGTPLTIPTYFPRNAAARDQLQLLTETFIASGYSNKALLEEIFASPYVNLASPDVGCGTPFAAPRIFNPWTTAEDDPERRGNSSADGAVAISSRTTARAAYSALGWPLAAYGSLFPGVRGYGQDPIGTSGTLERQFQDETGFFLKNSSPGFRGFDFQARLGWEDRMARCGKLAQNTQPDVIDYLVQTTQAPGVGTVRDVLKVLKDRIMGTPELEEPAEQAALATMLGTSLDADASTLTDPDRSLRRVCGVMISSPQFLMLGIPPKDTLEVPSLTPPAARYGALCEQLRAVSLPGLFVTCAGNDVPVHVEVSP